MNTEDFSQTKNSSSFKLKCGDIEKVVEWNLQGEYNARNVAMATVGDALVLGKENPLDIDLSSLADFKGVKRRQEIILDTPNNIKILRRVLFTFTQLSLLSTSYIINKALLSAKTLTVVKQN